MATTLTGPEKGEVVYFFFNSSVIFFYIAFKGKFFHVIVYSH